MLCHAGAPDTRDGLLRTGMHLQIRKCRPDPANRSQVLHNEAVHTCLVVRPDIGYQLSKFALLKKNVDRHIQLHRKKVAVADGLHHHILFRGLRRIRIGPGAEALPAHVDRVGAGMDRRHDRLKRPGRRQQLCGFISL